MLKEEDESFIHSLYETTTDGTRIKRILPSDDVTVDEDDCDSLPNLISSSSSTTNLLVESSSDEPSAPKLAKLEPQTSKSSCSKLTKNSLASMVKVKRKIRTPRQPADSIPPSACLDSSSKEPISNTKGVIVCSKNAESPALQAAIASKPVRKIAVNDNKPPSTSVSLVSTYSDSSSGDET